MRTFAVQKFIHGIDLKRVRIKLNMTQVEFACLVDVSKKTIERWESCDKEITGPIVTLVRMLDNNPSIVDDLEVPECKYSLRLFYMFQNQICTVIDVDEKNHQIDIKNYKSDYLFRAFGKNKRPTYEQYEEFLESRCFPRSRDKMKLMLREIQVPFYDPMMIIKKTEGRMAEDDFWIRIERC